MSKRGRPKTPSEEIREAIAGYLENLEGWKRIIEEKPELLTQDEFFIKKIRSELNSYVRKAIRAGLYSVPTLKDWINSLLGEHPPVLKDQINILLDQWIRTQRILGNRQELRKIKSGLEKGVRRRANPKEREKNDILLAKVFKLRGIVEGEDEPEGMLESIVKKGKFRRRVRHQVVDHVLLKNYIERQERERKQSHKLSWDKINEQLWSERIIKKKMRRQGFQKFLRRKFPWVDWKSV